MSTITPYLPNTLADIQNKVRRITGKPSENQITSDQINQYVNTFYVYDLPEHLRLESLRVNYQFVTTANVGIYDFPKDLYLTCMPPVFIAGYRSYMTQSRDNFFRINPNLNYLQQSVTTGNDETGPYSFTLINSPIMPGFKRNPPGAYSVSGSGTDVPASTINWSVLITGQGEAAANGISPWYSLIDDGQGNLFDPSDTSTLASKARGSINYITGYVSINATGFKDYIPTGNPINAQYVPYVASRPQSCCYYQDQISLYPIPDQAYSVSFEAFMYPTAFLGTNASSTQPQLNEWWQLLAYGAADKIFADNGDMENMQKYRPLLEEQLRLIQRRTLQQYSSERTASIYTEQCGFAQYPFGNIFSGF